MNNSLKVSCSTDNLIQIRAFVENTLKGHCLPDDLINLLILAVDEICANVIIHSNLRDPNKEIEVKILFDEDNVIFEILDSGKPFDPDTISEPHIPTMVKEKRKGGLGLMLVRRIMDSIELKKENSKTIYRLHKKVTFC